MKTSELVFQNKTHEGIPCQSRGQDSDFTAEGAGSILVRELGSPKPHSTAKTEEEKKLDKIRHMSPICRQENNQFYLIWVPMNLLKAV